MKNYPEILNAFALPEGERSAVPFGNGHINNTFLIRIAGTDRQYILQRINSYVFTHPKEVMENMQHVTSFLRGKIAAGGGNPDRETITLIPSRSGEAYAEDSDGQVWRVMLFVPDTFSPELPDEIRDRLPGKGQTLAYAVFPAFRRQGYMTEALQAVLPDLFASSGAAFVHCGHFEDNEPSRKLLRKLGFREFSGHTAGDRLMVDEILFR